MSHASRHFVEVVSHENEGRVRRIVDDSGQCDHQLFASTEVEACTRLVEQDHVGVVHERPSEKDALLLARGQRAEGPFGAVIHLHALEALEGAPSIGVVVGVPPRFEGGVPRGHHHVASRKCRPELGCERRRHVPDAPSQRANVGAAQGFARHRDDPASRMVVHRSDAHQGRLS